MLKIYNVTTAVSSNKAQKQKTNTKSVVATDKSEMIMTNLNQMAINNSVSFKGNSDNFEIGLSTEELKKRTHKDYLGVKKMLDIDSPEYNNLAMGDKQALKHLVKAAYIMDEVYLKQDNEKNIDFRESLKEKAEKGDEDAKMALTLFNAQKGFNSVDTEANKYTLKKGEIEKPGKAFYPSDLGQAEFHDVLTKMLNDGKKRQVKEILNQRTIIKREGSGLKAIDYTEEFKEEFQAAAKELEQAAKVSTNEDFNEYLRLQARALKENDAMLDAYADKKWATLQDTPLEFTITRENYEDELTGSVVENEELKGLLEKNGITPISKDMLGFRVGIVNKEGTDKLLEIKEYLPLMAENMPYKDQYEQNISTSADDEVKQTMVDVDLVCVTGDVGAWRGGITLAENLPNDDKLSLTIGGGRRNVYHRQIRQVADLKKVQQKLDAILDPEFHQYYENEADHWFTIGHENGHSLGPKSGTEALGKNKNIIEENKADMVAVAMMDVLTEKGMYTEFQKKQVLTSFITDNMLKAEPNMSQAHRVRSVMETNFFIKEGAINIDQDGVLHIELDKMVPTAKKMLGQIVKVQLSGDFNVGEKFVNENFVWTKEMDAMAQKLKQVNKTLNGQVESKLADKLAKED